ncbi:glycosyltransferase family 4 protein [Pontibacter sp. Tf4]|uniref:glycosyltransferase family 4 protein n=1 Tax=Pontibacter sp. Tf4 TaxID=2761620 RepID=UPI001626C19C|nr:glycosyltransferase family 4 protein [Pontibacter sp. Tf4]MBB6610710.1 glycosyltransferase family 4 protein [Pontibacter sp. Tf4]
MELTIGVCGPIGLNLLDWDLKHEELPETNAFPLTSHFINALLKRGYKVIGYTNSPVLQEPKVLQSGNLTICISTVKPKPGRRFFNYEIAELRKMIAAYPADIISAFWTYEYALAALRSNIPAVVNIHDVALKILLKQPDVFRFVRWMMNYRSVSKAEYLVANSNYTYSLLASAEKAKTVTINNFYTPEIEKISKTIPVKGNYIVSVVQGFTKRKNIHGSLQAFAKVRARFPDLEYHLVGVEMEENGLAHQYAKQLGIADGVKFIGCLEFDDVVKEIAGAKVLVHPSYEESFGMAVLEAMVAGTPVVGGENSGFVPELLAHGKAGQLCDVTSPEAMANCTIKLLEDEQLWQETVRYAKQYAKANFSEDVVLQQHLALFGRVLGRKLVPAQEPYEPVPGRRLSA